MRLSKPGIVADPLPGEPAHGPPDRPADPLPLRYDHNLRFWSGPLRGTGDVLFETELTITFGEFLSAIFWELGCHGSPAERDDASARLRERVEAIERLDNGTGGPTVGHGQ